MDESGNVWSYTNGSPAWALISTPNPMSCISVSAHEWIWGIDNNKEVWRLDVSGTWVSQPSLPTTTPSFICTADDQTTLVLDSDNNVFIYVPGAEKQGSWTQITNDNAVQLSRLAVVNQAQVWAIGPSGAYTYCPLNWTKTIPASSYTQVTAQNQNSAWFLLLTNGSVVQVAQNPAGSNNLGGGLLQISGATDGTLWGIGNGVDHNCWQYDSGTTWTAQPVSVQDNAEVAAVAVGNASLVYALDSLGNVYQFTDSAWQTVSNASSGGPYLISLGVASDGTLLATDQNQYVYIYQNGSWDQVLPVVTAGQVSAGSSEDVWSIDGGGNPAYLINSFPPTAAIAGGQKPALKMEKAERPPEKH